MSKITIPINEAPGEIRETIRRVLRSHMLAVCSATPSLHTSQSLTARLAEPIDDSDASYLIDKLELLTCNAIAQLAAHEAGAITPERFEQLLGELGNNATQQLVNLSMNADLDAEERERLGEAICPTHAIERRRCGCAATDRQRLARVDGASFGNPPTFALRGVPANGLPPGEYTVVLCTCSLRPARPGDVDDHAADCAISRAARGRRPRTDPEDLRAVVRDYLTAADAFDATNVSDPKFKRMGVALGELQSKLRKAVTP